VVSVVDRTWAVGASARPLLNLCRAHRACVSIRHHAPRTPGATHSCVCARLAVRAHDKGESEKPALDSSPSSSFSLARSSPHDVMHWHDHKQRRRRHNPPPSFLPHSSPPSLRHTRAAPQLHFTIPDHQLASTQARTPEQKPPRLWIRAAAVLPRRHLLRSLQPSEWNPR
jgi:hypothetical protein